MPVTHPPSPESLRALVIDEAIARAAEVAAADAVPADLLDALARSGMLRLTHPVELGGWGLSPPDFQPYLELAGQAPAWVRMLTHVGNGLWRPLERYGTPEQRETVRAAGTGDALFAFALTEASGGTGRDLQSRAMRTATGDWLVSGEKHLITFADRASHFLLTVATDDRGAADSLTTFLIPRDHQGLVIETDQHTMGLPGTGHGRLSYEAMVVPDGLRLGDVGQGLDVAMCFLDYSRISLSTCMVGLAQRALDEAVRYARRRTTFGRPIADRQAIQVHLAQMQSDVVAARALVYDVGRRQATHEPVAAAAATAKLFCQQMVGRVTDRALQVHGGLGYTSDAPIEQIYRDARGFWFEEGTAEIQQLVIARALLRDEEAP